MAVEITTSSSALLTVVAKKLAETNYFDSYKYIIYKCNNNYHLIVQNVNIIHSTLASIISELTDIKVIAFKDFTTKVGESFVAKTLMTNMKLN